MKTIFAYFLLSLLLNLLFINSAYPYDNLASDAKAQKYLEEKFNFSKEDFYHYLKPHGRGHLFIYVVLAHESNKPLDYIISFANNFKYSTGADKIFEAEGMVMAIIIFAKETGHTFDEIIAMSDNGNPQKLERLEKTLDIKRDRFNKSLNEFRIKLNLQPKNFE